MFLVVNHEQDLQPQKPKKKQMSFHWSQNTICFVLIGLKRKLYFSFTRN